jgi:hypothetical protein
MEYPNSGGLFTTKQKRNDRSPDMYGDIKIEKDLILSMLEKAEGEEFIAIKLDAWLKKDKHDNRMVSLKVNTYEKTDPVSNAKDPWDD